MFRPVSISDCQAKLFAHELTRRCPPDSADRLTSALVDAQVDLNPHQVEAALFAFQSPLSKGVLLADEVGLGKTIEAGLVIAQKWAERRRRILVITPANLRKQWHQELGEKFFLPCTILESKPYNEAIRQGRFRPFERADHVVICSYQFAKSKAGDVNAVPWDLVVIDEAHRLRNVYKPNNVIAHTIKAALASSPKLLLTATPLQNSLLELFGLVSVIDDQVFGDLRSFREQFADLSEDQVFLTLKRRLGPICYRTLRRQVTPYVSYTKRLPLVEEFSPGESEDQLYNQVSDYLRRDNLQALPNSQRTLMTLVMRKLLASSTFAIAGALDTLVRRLSARLGRQAPVQPLETEMAGDYETLDETAEEWPDEDPLDAPLSDADRAALEREIADLTTFRDLAAGITHNAKGQALLQALGVAFDRATGLGAAQKAIIFTESRKTQQYLERLLGDSPWRDGIVLFNGTNTDPGSRAIYAAWLDQHKGTDRVTGSKTADMRSALVEYFRDQGRIMIATEAGAEGINLQFCSLVVNYDLPWNPQRIEQRIGRCHRYGQKHDVVVVNFLNRKNAADQRVFQLLSEKFKLFEGVFGASDEVLGSLESGIDFERRIAGIYQQCRRTEEIQAAFDALQLELNFEISETLERARQLLLENFDDEVREKLRVRNEASKASLGRYEQLLMDLTRHELRDVAVFGDDSSFTLERCPFSGDIPLGRYELPRRSGDAHLYRLNHPLAEAVVTAAKTRPCPEAPVPLVFDLSGYRGRVSALEALRGQRGLVSATRFTIEALEQAEDYLVLAATTAEGGNVEQDVARRMLSLPLRDSAPALPWWLDEHVRSLNDKTQAYEGQVRRTVTERNAAIFEAESEKLEGWSDDLKLGLEREIKNLDRQIKDARRAATAAGSLEDKLRAQKAMRALEGERTKRRRALFDAQDAIDAKREALIAGIEAKLAQTVTSEPLFSIAWTIA